MEPLDVPVVVSNHPPTVHVISPPGEVDQASEHSFKVDVVSEDEPESEHELAGEEDGDVDEPRKHQPTNIVFDSPHQHPGPDHEESEHNDAEVGGVLSGAVQVGLEQR